MPTIMKNNIAYAGSYVNKNMELTLAEYLELEQNGQVHPDITYFITDANNEIDIQDFEVLVTFTSESTFTTNKTFTEILEAYNNNKNIKFIADNNMVLNGTVHISQYSIVICGTSFWEKEYFGENENFGNFITYRFCMYPDESTYFETSPVLNRNAMKEVTIENVAITTKSSNGVYYGTIISYEDLGIPQWRIASIVLLNWEGATASFTPYLHYNQGINVMSDISQTVAKMSLRIFWT